MYGEIWVMEFGGRVHDADCPKQNLSFSIATSSIANQVRLKVKGYVCFTYLSNFEHFTVATMTWLTFMEYLCHK
jgi:hypothetical protein